jgi:hypothetical protein
MIRDRGHWKAAPAPFTPLNPDRVQFLTLHRISTPTITPHLPATHAHCIEWLQTEQLTAMDRGLPDIPWNAVCCPHGEMFDCLGAEQLPYQNGDIGPAESRVSLSVLVLSGDGQDVGVPSVQADVVKAYREHYFGVFYPTARFVVHADWEKESECPGDDWRIWVAEMEGERRRVGAEG